MFTGGSSFYPHWSRFVFLKRTSDGFKIVSEQMGFYGPKRYEVANGEVLHEKISLVNETEQIINIGKNITGTVIEYQGPDLRFGNGRSGRDGLTPADIGPVLREWGYDYLVDKAQPDGAAPQK